MEKYKRALNTVQWLIWPSISNMGPVSEYPLVGSTPLKGSETILGPAQDLSQRFSDLTCKSAWCWFSQASCLKSWFGVIFDIPLTYVHCLLNTDYFYLIPIIPSSFFLSGYLIFYLSSKLLQWASNHESFCHRGSASPNWYSILSSS